MPETPKEPDGGQKSTLEQAISDLEKEGNTFEGRKPTEPETPKVEPPKEPPKEPPAGEPKPPIEPPKEPRQPRMMPRWQHEVEVKKREEAMRIQFEEKEKALREAVLKNPPPSPVDDVKASREWLATNFPDLTDETIEHFSRALHGSKPSSELEKRLEALEAQNKELLTGREKQLDQIEQAEFEKEWNQSVAPIVKERYSGLTDGQLAEIKEKLQELGYSDEYLKVSLPKVFRAEEEEIMKLITPHKKSAEGGKGGTSRMDTINFENISDDDISKMDEKTFEAFMDYKKLQDKKRTA